MTWSANPFRNLARVLRDPCFASKAQDPKPGGDEPGLVSVRHEPLASHEQKVDKADADVLGPSQNRQGMPRSENPASACPADPLDAMIDGARRSGCLIEFSEAEWDAYMPRVIAAAKRFMQGAGADRDDLGYRDPHRLDPYDPEPQ